MFCPQCGSDAEEARFCPECGTSLDPVRTVTGEADLRDETGPARSPAARTTGSRGKRPRAEVAAHDRRRPDRSRSALSRLAPLVPTNRRRISPTVIWMSLAAAGGRGRHRRVRLRRTPSDAADGSPSGGQTTSSITADTSGSFAELVQRANGLYDKGAQAFQDNDQNAGVQHFAAAAKVYRAAWKQQATDPNVGTDYATSLFYSGDAEGALTQVDEVLAGSPDFQTAHLNKGVYLETAAQAAREAGQTAEADSLLAQAKAAYEKAVSIDPGSSAGAKAAEALAGL